MCPLSDKGRKKAFEREKRARVIKRQSETPSARVPNFLDCQVERSAQRSVFGRIHSSSPSFSSLPAFSHPTRRYPYPSISLSVTMPINQPANQIKLTNVSVVRLRKGGKRFEVACYKNKVVDWRNGTETNLDEVVQIENVFTNVSKGAAAPQEDLKKAFGTTDVEAIVKEILKKGELQVGEKERNQGLDASWREIVTLVCEKCVDPTSQRPYPYGIIDKAMSDIHYSIKTGKSAKSQVS